jgi:hypothetical protein
VKRKLTLIALIIAAAAVLIFAIPALGLRPTSFVSECTWARWQAKMGYNVPQCTCCVQPPTPPSLPVPDAREQR